MARKKELEIKVETIKLGSKVECKGYLKKCKKQYCLPNLKIENFTPSQLEMIAKDNGDIRFIGVGEEISQQEYKFVEKEFSGVFVGKQKIHTKKYFYFDGSEEYGYGDDLSVNIKTRKENADMVEVAKVYYSCGHTRLVPLDDLKVVD